MEKKLREIWMSHLVLLKTAVEQLGAPNVDSVEHVADVEVEKGPAVQREHLVR